MNDSFMGRFFKQLVLIAIFVGVGYYAYNNMDSFGGSDAPNKTVESLGDKLRGKVNDTFGEEGLTQDDFGYPEGKNQGDRPYAKYNEQSLNAVRDKFSEPKKAPGYSRDKFFTQDGNSWNKVKRAESQKVGWKDFPDENCTIRQAVLVENGSNITYDKGCKNLKGQWVDAYGERKPNGEIFYKKSKKATDYDIDHIVALSLAWRSGMDQYSDEQRNMLANDKANLVVAEKGLNRSKGDQSIDQWAPVQGSKNRCDYADRYVYVKAKYGLTVTAAELKTIERILSGCNEKK